MMIMTGQYDDNDRAIWWLWQGNMMMIREINMMMLTGKYVEDEKANMMMASGQYDDDDRTIW